MSAASSSLDDSDELLLRWSEDEFTPSREELVQILEARISEAVICSALEVVEKTRVYLVGKNSTESGIVQSCQASGKKFIVTILFNSETSIPPIDPGVLLVDTFMTEEQELKILDEVDEEIQRQQCQSLTAAQSNTKSTAAKGQLF
jgi:hypothetical protein